MQEHCNTIPVLQLDRPTVFPQICLPAKIILNQHIKCCKGRVSTWLSSELVERRSPCTLLLNPLHLWWWSRTDQFQIQRNHSKPALKPKKTSKHPVCHYRSIDFTIFSTSHYFFFNHKIPPGWLFCLQPQKRMANANTHQRPCQQAERDPALLVKGVGCAITA